MPQDWEHSPIGPWLRVYAGSMYRQLYGYISVYSDSFVEASVWDMRHGPIGFRPVASERFIDADCLARAKAWCDETATARL